jgi:DNA-binding CsgD family transcriptional regulator
MANRPLAVPETRVHDALQAEPLSQCTLPFLIVINRDFTVELTSQSLEDGPLCPNFVDMETRRLAPALDAIVRDLVSSWTGVDQRDPRTFAFLPPNYCVVRVTPLHGGTQPLVAVSIDHRRDRDHFARAARVYSLSPRETDVLRLVLEGASASEIGTALSIAESTVQGYFKRLLSKTRSRNRPAMVAKVLGWDSLPGERPDESDIA